MKVLDSHLLDNVRQQLLPGGSAMAVRRILVIHFTNGASAKSSIDHWKSLGNGICAHIIIDRDGTIIQCRAFDRTCGHAGVSRWRDPKSGKLHVFANKFSIGIELANAGDSVEEVNGKLLAFGRAECPAGTTKAKHRNGGALTHWENYPAAQWLACAAVSKLLVERYNLDDVVGHEDIAPERKNDPGPAFDMLALRKECGFAGLPTVNRL